MKKCLPSESDEHNKENKRTEYERKTGDSSRDGKSYFSYYSQRKRFTDEMQAIKKHDLEEKCLRQSMEHVQRLWVRNKLGTQRAKRKQNVFIVLYFNDENGKS